MQLQFEITEDLEAQNEIGWSAASHLPPPQAEVLYGDTIVGDDGNQIVCVFNSKKVRLVAIAC